MGCISSKLLATTDIDNGFLFGDRRTSGEPPNHIVSLTSTTYGFLNLDEPKSKEEDKETKPWRRSPPTPLIIPSHFKSKVTCEEEPPEIINVRDLMEDLDDGTPFWTPLKRLDRTMTPKQQRMPTPGTIPSPKKNRRRLFSGKENNNSPKPERSVLDPNRVVLKPFNSSEKGKKWIGPIPSIHSKSTPADAKVERLKESSGSSSSRRSLSPFFDPELVDSFERELCEEGEQIKKMVDPHPRIKKARASSALLLESFEEKCPPGGANAVVLYTTTLRGIRKTFEDCNAVRSAIEINEVQVIERDISMDSGYREELRELMGRKEVKVPMVFVKGRLIGGADEVLKLEEEGKLALLLEGIQKAELWCEGCGGMRFVMCMECSGSCKVLHEEQKKMVRCGECNENGLIHCPICC